jgi:hypothetical protein
MITSHHVHASRLAGMNYCCPRVFDSRESIATRHRLKLEVPD